MNAKKVIFALWLVLIFTALIKGELQAQQSYAISGSVTNLATQTPLTNVLVTVKDASSTTAGFTLSDASGYYTVSLSSPDVYTVSASKSGYDDASPPDRPVDIADVSPNAIVNLSMITQFDSLSLAAGWNFISFTQLPSSPASIETVLKDVSPQVRIVWGYDNSSKTWLKYKGQGTGVMGQNTLTSFEFGKGYWIYMDAPDTINLISCSPPDSVSIGLISGWNLIGYNGPDNLALSQATQGISGKWSIIWNWDNSLWYGKHAAIASLPLSIQPLVTFNRSRAYWIRAKEATLWDQFIYNAAIQEGQAAAQDIIDQGHASALTIALVDANRIIWAQTFGIADREAGQAPSDTTMFGIGSVSKMFAAIAAMKLVERGVIDLDTPLVNYLPSFRMASVNYDKITIRMLLNHSSGFPGTDYHNVETTSPVPGYANQVLQTLSTARLKAPPGYMNVYSNDGFTLIEALVQAKTGKSYVQFVQDEILTPLGMNNTSHTISAFPAGSYAKAYVEGVVQPQEFVNAFASGGIYSTAKDMARIVMMFLGNGTFGATRILSGASVAQMAADQTIGTFNPVRFGSTAFGLGWDTVLQPGLAAVGFDGWLKGGDVTSYHAAIAVSPKAQLGIVVIGASGFDSGSATTIAERVLLRALVENGRIAAFPSALPNAVPPTVPVPGGLLAAITGVYANYNTIVRIPDDGSLQPEVLSTTAGWVQGCPWKYRGDGWFSCNENPLRAYKVVDAGGTQYMLKRAPTGYGHYLDYSVEYQRVRGTAGSLLAAWSGRLSSTWLVANENPDALGWSTMDPRLRLAAVPGASGLIAFIPPPPADAGFHIVDPSASDTVASMMLTIPQISGRDLDDLNIVVRGGVEWIRLGSYLFQPLAAVPVLTRGAAATVTIGPEGYAEWRSVASDVTPAKVTITTTGAWRIYDPKFTSLANGKGNGVASLPQGSGLGYVILFGDPGQTIMVAVQ